MLFQTFLMDNFQVGGSGFVDIFLHSLNVLEFGVSVLFELFCDFGESNDFRFEGDVLKKLSVVLLGFEGLEGFDALHDGRVFHVLFADEGSECKQE